MYYIITLGLVSFAFYRLLQRYRAELVEQVERLQNQFNLTRSDFENLYENEKSHLSQMNERHSKLEASVNSVALRLKKIEDTPEKRSKDATNNAVNEFLKRSW